MIQSNKTLPTVSVIVPVYNDPTGLRTCLECLESQIYPKEKLNIIVVDNKSTDHTPDVAKEFDVELLHENNIQGSYAARNKGIKHSNNEIIAMTDSDCKPIDKWIAHGVHKLLNQPADLIGGAVKFEFSKSPSNSEILDSISNMQNKENIETRNVAKTANLFSNREVFKEVGLFPHELISGGDVSWTRRATESGFKLSYSSNAIVFHPTRSFLPLVKKQFRVGRGISQSSQSKSILRLLLPPNPIRIFKKMRKNNVRTRNFLPVWLIGWVLKTVTAIGNLYEGIN